jgi:hypothetical protein
MHYGRKSYAEMDLSAIKCSKRRRAVRWFGRLYHATPKWADMKKVRAVYRERDRRRAAGEDVEVDHIVPLFHPLVCGLHNEFNIRVFPAGPNNAKSNHTWPDMPGENRELFNSPWEPEQYALPLHA